MALIALLGVVILGIGDTETECSIAIDLRYKSATFELQLFELTRIRFRCWLKLEIASLSVHLVLEQPILQL